MSFTKTVYRPALDGLRAIALTAVLLYHAGVPWVRGGFLGVDLFFVLSGYLITGLLLNEWRQWRSIDLVAFYTRRARRLLPALVTVVAAVATWTFLFAAPDKVAAIRADGLSALAYVANLRFIVMEQSYFDQFGDPSPFRHTWSLAIEEQYYLLFPLLLIGLLRALRGRRRVAWALALGAIGSAAWMGHLYVPGSDPSRVYYGTDTRIQELLVGSTLAVLLTGRTRTPEMARRARWFAPVALVLVVAALAVLRDTGPHLYQGGFLGLSIIVAALIAGVELDRRGGVARVLSWGPLVRIGVISYGLYLWHWPVFVALSEPRTGLNGLPLIALRLGLTGLLSVASYRLIEHPIRRGTVPRWASGRSWPTLRWALPAVSVAALVTATAGAPEGSRPAGTTLTTQGQEGEDVRRVMLVGDSVPWSLTTNFPASRYPGTRLSTLTPFGCGLVRFQHAAEGEAVPTPDNCLTGTLVRPEAIKEFKPQVALIFLGLGEMYDAKIGDDVLVLGSSRHMEWLSGQLDTIIEPFSALEVPVRLVNVGCYQVPDDNSVIAEVTNSTERVTALNRAIEEYARARSLPVVDLHDYVCADGYRNEVPGVDGAIRDDGIHYTAAGAAWVWKFLDGQTDGASRTRDASGRS